MRETLTDKVSRMLAGRDEPEHDSTTQSEPVKEYDVYVEPDRITIIPKLKPDESAMVESTPTPQIQPEPFDKGMLTTGAFFVCLVLSCLVLQVFFLLNPPIAIVTFTPKSQQVTLSGTLQLGRLIAPITLRESQKVPTTGRGHQDARNAVGYITFYNGQFQSVTIPAGIMVTSASGIHIVTDKDSVIPAANPPYLGVITMSAHALNPGAKGNIPAYDINETCCATSVLVKNTATFTGGQDARDFQTVAKRDIDTPVIQLKTTLAQSVLGALQGQLKQGEQLQLLPCMPTATSDHQLGEEATQITISVSETCSAVTYISQRVQEKVTALLSAQAVKKLGTGYSLFGQVQVTVKQATVTHTTTPLVFLSFQAHGTFVYALLREAQDRIKRSILGKLKQEALRLLLSQPGIEHASIRLEGFGDDTRIPKNCSLIRITLFVM